MAQTTQKQVGTGGLASSDPKSPVHRGPSAQQIESFVAHWLKAIKRGKRRMETKPRSKADPIERRIESAFRPGTFIRDGECFSFVSRLEEVAATIDTLVAAEPARAVALYEA